MSNKSPTYEEVCAKHGCALEIYERPQVFDPPQMMYVWAWDRPGIKVYRRKVSAILPKSSNRFSRVVANGDMYRYCAKIPGMHYPPEGELIKYDQPDSREKTIIGQPPPPNSLEEQPEITEHLAELYMKLMPQTPPRQSINAPFSIYPTHRPLLKSLEERPDDGSATKSLLERLCTWSIWRSVKKRMRPIERTIRRICRADLEAYIQLNVPLLETNQYAGLVLLSDCDDDVRRMRSALALRGINPKKLLVLSGDTPECKIFNRIKRHFSELDADFAVEGYDNDEPFLVLRICIF